MSLPDTLRNLLTAPGPSGRESAAAAVWQAAAREFADDVQSDLLGSSTARVAGTGGGPRLAVVGHIDEIGVMVTHIDDEGFLWFGGVGGWDPVNLVGQRVELHTRDGDVVPGVVGKKPIHLLESEEREKAPKLKDLHIDIGAEGRRRGARARARRRLGASSPASRSSSRRAASRRARWTTASGCWIALEAARLVSEAGGAPGEVVAVRGRAGGDDVRRRDDDGVRARARRRDRRRRHARHRRAGHRQAPGGRPRPRLGRGRQHRRRSPHPLVVELLRETAEAEGIAFAEEAGGARHVHRRRRDPPQPQRRAVRDRLDPAALHALAGRGRAALRRRGVREAHRRVRAAARRGDDVRPLERRDEQGARSADPTPGRRSAGRAGATARPACRPAPTARRPRRRSRRGRARRKRPSSRCRRAAAARGSGR